jgi:hypothetical protein
MWSWTESAPASAAPEINAAEPLTAAHTDQTTLAPANVRATLSVRTGSWSGSARAAVAENGDPFRAMPIQKAKAAIPAALQYRERTMPPLPAATPEGVGFDPARLRQAHPATP